MSQIDEIAPDVFRISTYIQDFNLQFVQFLVRDEEPLLYHTGMRGLFPAVREAVTRLIDPVDLRWIGFSHFEADECGALREWQELAPNADAVCSLVGKLVSVDDVVAARPARALDDGEVLVTGRCRFRFIQTPQVPHAWDAGHLFEETGATLLCSDLFGHSGDVEASTSSDVLGRFREMMAGYEGTPFGNYMPFTTRTEMILQRLADLAPRTLATMHGSTFVGDGAAAIGEMTRIWREIMAPAP